jgi:hypothetical protein
LPQDEAQNAMDGVLRGEYVLTDDDLKLFYDLQDFVIYVELTFKLDVLSF